MIYRLLAFLALNFGALAIGALFTNTGVSSDWYQGLAKAPWTPPGWFFGFAWSTIMLCFSFYMAYLWPLIQNKSRLITLYVIQWILNVSWNPVFFYYHYVWAGLAVIIGLTVIVGMFLSRYREELHSKSALILPYFLWLLVATSLNAYIMLYN